MFRSVLSFLIIISLVFSLVHCTKEAPPVGPPVPVVPVLPETPYNYADISLPTHFTSSALSFFESIPPDNPVTNDGATLGRVLFYDKNLSMSRKVSCGSCHFQHKGFADTVALSMGHQGGLTRRNAMHLVNLQYNRRFFWDLRALGLETQVLMPVQDSIEMGMSLDTLVARLNKEDYYPSLFTNAFGDPEITSTRIAAALAQFVRSIVSYQTKYDEGIVADFANFNSQELAGKALYFNGITKCNQCHSTANFFDPGGRNTGLDVDYTDEGRFEITGIESDKGIFKVPSLRNVALTAPYMHDGRFATLEEVIDQYDNGVQPHANLDDRLTANNQIGGIPYSLHLSSSEKAALIAFLHTLTDFSVVTDVKFSNPFEE